MEEEGLSRTLTYSNISDHDLDGIIRTIKRQHPNDGERLMLGHLARCGIRVQRSRLRSSIHRIDPINTALRRSIAIRRQSYHSNGANTVWHIDGNHKMIRWHLVIHGGIDGFSRTVVFLQCSNNNKALTVLNCFTKATQLYDIPHKIRTDRGGENTKIWRFMVHHYSSPSAVITGSSVHNERIERLWRDVKRSVSSLFIHEFCTLEDNETLDPLNNLDIFCLHWVYLPIINRNEHNLTPNQLFCQGLLSQTQTQPASTPGNLQMPLPSDSNTVVVPVERFQPCSSLKVTLQAITYDSITIHEAASKYEQITELVGHHLMNNCNLCV